VSVAAALAVGAALLASGAFAALRGGGAARQLAALPVLGAGASIALAGAARLAAGRADPDSGQELAALVAVAALAATILGVAWARRGAAR
jgi:hypothetical protein